MDGTGFAGRMEVLSEPSGRRLWSVEMKLRIVAESYAPGVMVGDVARRYDLRPTQVTTWRRLYRRGELVPRGSPPLPPVLGRSDARLTPPTAGPPGAPAFVPLMLEDEALSLTDGTLGGPPTAAPGPPLPTGSFAGSGVGAERIEIEAGGVTVRLPAGVSADRLAAIVAALRAPA